MDRASRFCRRTFLGDAWRTVAWGAAGVVTLGLAGMLRHVVGRTIDIPLPADLLERAGRQDGVQVDGIFVRWSGDTPTAFSLRCTHLGCPLVWDQATRQFQCRCHGAVFDELGEVVSGPAPRALDRYATKMKDGVLYVGGLEEA